MANVWTTKPSAMKQKLAAAKTLIIAHAALMIAIVALTELISGAAHQIKNVGKSHKNALIQLIALMVKLDAILTLTNLAVAHLKTIALAVMYQKAAVFLV